MDNAAKSFPWGKVVESDQERSGQPTGCVVCQEEQPVANAVQLSCCGATFCHGCFYRHRTTDNKYATYENSKCPACRGTITSTPHLDKVVQQIQQSQLQSELDHANSDHIKTVLSSNDVPEVIAEGFTKRLRRTPTPLRDNPPLYEDVLPESVTDILVGIEDSEPGSERFTVVNGGHFTRRKGERVNHRKKIPLKVVYDDLLPKLMKLSPDSEEYFILLNALVVWRFTAQRTTVDEKEVVAAISYSKKGTAKRKVYSAAAVCPANDRNVNNTPLRMEDVPGYDTKHKKTCDDYPKSLDEFIKEFVQWMKDHPEYEYIREVVLQIAEHQREIVQWLLNNPDKLNEVWRKYHPKQWYANWMMEKMEVGELCDPECPFCKGQEKKSPFFCDANHAGQAGVEAKRRHRHNNSKGKATTLVQPVHYNEYQFKDQEEHLDPVCSCWHMYVTFDKIRNMKGQYTFKERWQYVLVTGLVLHVNGYQCFMSDDEVNWDNYTAYDTQHSTALMDALIHETQYATRKMGKISAIWSRTHHATYAEFRDAVFREVVKVVLCKRTAHSLIDWGIARQQFFPGMPIYPFVGQTFNGFNGTAALVPRLLPPPPTRIKATSTTTCTTNTTESPTTITTMNTTITTFITTKTTTSTKVATQWEVSSHDRKLLQKEVARLNNQAKTTTSTKVATQRKASTKVATQRKASTKVATQRKASTKVATQPRSNNQVKLKEACDKGRFTEEQNRTETVQTSFEEDVRLRIIKFKEEKKRKAEEKQKAQQGSKKEDAIENEAKEVDDEMEKKKAATAHQNIATARANNEAPKIEDLIAASRARSAAKVAARQQHLSATAKTTTSSRARAKG